MLYILNIYNSTQSDWLWAPYFVNYFETVLFLSRWAFYKKCFFWWGTKKMLYIQNWWTIPLSTLFSQLFCFKVISSRWTFYKKCFFLLRHKNCYIFKIGEQSLKHPTPWQWPCAQVKITGHTLSYPPPPPNIFKPLSDSLIFSPFFLHSFFLIFFLSFSFPPIPSFLSSFPFSSFPSVFFLTVDR